MERKPIKYWLKKYKRLVSCLRILLIYWIFLLIAKYSRVFSVGLNPQSIGNLVIAGIVVVYRFLSIAYIPALLVLWIFEILQKPLEKENTSA